jgi:hypothetical protein
MPAWRDKNEGRFGMQIIAWGTLGAAVLVALAVPAGAQQPTQAQANAIRQACRADYQSHCASVPAGGSAALQCLQQNKAVVSMPCQQALGALAGPASGPPPATMPPATAQAPTTSAPMSRRQEIAMLRRDCRTDYQKFCSKVQIGGGHAIGCLQAHGPQLSSQCRSALLTARQNP